MRFLNDLLGDCTVSEIMINAPKEVWIEQEGKLILTDAKFQNEEELVQVAHKIASYLGQTIDESNPVVDASLADGSRVHIVIPPVALKGVTVTIIKSFTSDNHAETMLRIKSSDE